MNLAELPDLLAGPILRRCEPGRICIWIATKTLPASVHGEVYRLAGGQPDRLDDPAGQSAQAQTVRLGAALFVTLLSVRPGHAAEFPRGEVLGYDVRLDGDGLEARGLTSGDGTIALGAYPLPTFLLPPDGADPLTVLHASCRKPHGHGDDGLAQAAAHLAAVATDPARRPAALFLTGDQIYADDVAGPLMTRLTDLAGALCPGEPPVPGLLWPPAGLGLYGRKARVKRATRFTSGKMDNHLVAFGEYAAMYLMAWNVATWGGGLRSANAAFPSRSVRVPKRTKELRSRYNAEKRRLKPALRALPAVRRLLANVPTYMAFDDHDVTDDWNITPRWRARVRGTGTGSRIVANALAAYWAFQGWGNDPDRFGPAFVQGISGFLGGGGGAAAFVDGLWGFDRWGFNAPRPVPAVSLDTRTRRRQTGPRGDPPWLMDGAALTDLAAAVQAAAPPGGGPLLIVSPPPVLGVGLIEKFQDVLIEQARWKASNADVEAWTANHEGFAHFLKTLLGGLAGRRCVFLSGDVHYASTFNAAFLMGGQRFEIAQLTSSAAKNAPSLAWLVRLIGRWDTDAPVYGWDARPPMPGLTALRAKKKKREPHVPNRLRSDLVRLARLTRGTPILLTDADRTLLGITRPPDWEIRKRYVVPPGGGRLATDTNAGLVAVHGNGTVVHTLLTAGGDHEAIIGGPVP